MKIKLPLEISLTNFKDRLREEPKRNGNDSFSGEDLAILGMDYWGEGKNLKVEPSSPSYRFPMNGGGYYSAEEVYKRLVKLKRIIPPPTSPYAR